MKKNMILIAMMLITFPAFAEDRVGDIRDTTKMERRVEAKNYASFSLGPSTMDNLGTDKPGQYLSLGYLWETTPYAAVKATASGAFNFNDRNASVLAGTIGANFYFTRTSISPFAGFDFGYGVAATNADDLDTVHGWAGGLNLGLAFFRTSSVQLHIAASYLRVFADTGDGQPSYGAATIGLLF